VFSEVLAARGIVFEGSIATSSEPLPAGLRVLASLDSAPLSEILKGINKPSQNLHTEMLLRLLGAHVKGQGSLEAGHEALGEFLERSGGREGARLAAGRLGAVALGPAAAARAGQPAGRDGPPPRAHRPSARACRSPASTGC
jgi:hypothetical protein